ncbi:hypothetical protein SCUCBS95973_006485 [Sporothrix curviconia]|uniref:Uncharacterized protein n=1 Tax=Sporothrix curviconia TaxID=1260050 RepID=A0ABP0C5X6_9PEZI
MAGLPPNNNQAGRGKKRTIDEINGPIEFPATTRVRDFAYIEDGRMLPRVDLPAIRHRRHRRRTVPNSNRTILATIREASEETQKDASAAAHASGENSCSKEDNSDTTSIDAANATATADTNGRGGGISSRAVQNLRPVASQGVQPVVAQSLQPVAAQGLQPAAVHSLQPAVHSLQPVATHILQPVAAQTVQPAVRAWPSGDKLSDDLIEGVLNLDDYPEDLDEKDDDDIEEDDELRAASLEVHPSTSFSNPILSNQQYAAQSSVGLTIHRRALPGSLATPFSVVTISGLAAIGSRSVLAGQFLLADLYLLAECRMPTGLRALCSTNQLGCRRMSASASASLLADLYLHVPAQQTQQVAASHPVRASGTSASQQVVLPDSNQPPPLPFADYPFLSVEPNDFEGEDREQYVRNMHRQNRANRQFRVILSSELFTFPPESPEAAPRRPNRIAANAVACRSNNNNGAGARNLASSQHPVGSSEYNVDEIELAGAPRRQKHQH